MTPIILTSCIYNLIISNSEECIKTREPFNRRLLFYYYVLMMEESDLEKLDVKRVGLEEDRIILEFAKNSLQSYLDNLPTKLSNDKIAVLEEKDKNVKAWLEFKIQQKTLLTEIINIYNDEMNKLLKDDSL